MTTDKPARRPDPARVFEESTALVTGHTGFKGSWLSLWLETLGARVVGLSDAEPSLGAFHELGVSSFVDGRKGDIRSGDDCRAAFDAARPRVVFHLAAQPLVRTGWADRVATFETNVMGTINVVEAALACDSVEAVIVITTDKVYVNHEHGRAFEESDPLGGHDPYSASKAAAEIVLAPYRDPVHMGLRPRPVVSLRAGNVIGGGDRAKDRLVPDVLRALDTGGTVTLRRPDAVRPWQHVLDCLWGYLLAGAAAIDGASIGDSYNLAHSAGDHTVLDVARQVVDAWGDPRDVIEVERDDSTAEATLLHLDASSAARDLGWSAKWTVARAIEETVRYDRAGDKVSAGRSQIAEHMASPYLD